MERESSASSNGCGVCDMEHGDKMRQLARVSTVLDKTNETRCLRRRKDREKLAVLIIPSTCALN